MDDNIAGIKNDPLRRLESLLEMQGHAELFKLLINMLSNRANLTDRVSRADHKIIAKIHNFAHVQDNNIQGFCVRSKFCN